MITLASISETAAGIVEKFGIDWPLLLAQGVNFVIVAFVIWQFGLKKVLLTVKEREDSGVKDNLIRIAVGLEDIDDIIRDLNYLSN